MEDVVRDVVVVGGGAAGLSAGLMLARARRRVTVVDAGAPRNAPAAGVHALLALDGVSPAELLARGRAEVTGYGGEIIAGEVTAVSTAPEGFAVKIMTNGGGLRARRLLIATGLVDELPEIPGLRERWGREVIHCPYCHGWEVRDRLIGVLVVPGPVVRLEAGHDHALGVRLDGGRLTEVDVVAVASRMVARAGVFSDLGIEPAEHLMGSYIAADQTGRTAVPGVWVEDTDRAVARLAQAGATR
jgi:alkyl hydroperoxide reductase subunit AhpF